MRRTILLLLAIALLGGRSVHSKSFDPSVSDEMIDFLNTNVVDTNYPIEDLKCGEHHVFSNDHDFYWFPHGGYKFKLCRQCQLLWEVSVGGVMHSYGSKKAHLRTPSNYGYWAGTQWGQCEPEPPFEWQPGDGLE